MTCKQVTGLFCQCTTCGMSLLACTVAWMALTHAVEGGTAFDLTLLHALGRQADLRCYVIRCSLENLERIMMYSTGILG